MNIQVIGFIPPIEGVEGTFNTFRLGGTYAKRLNAGDEVLLMNEKSKTVFGRARVESVEVGELWDLCVVHASANHTELANEPNEAPERLLKTVQKIYGPHIAPAGKRTTVIYLKRIE